jgi:hypothetical protein
MGSWQVSILEDVLSLVIVILSLSGPAPSPDCCGDIFLCREL